MENDLVLIITERGNENSVRFRSLKNHIRFNVLKRIHSFNVLFKIRFNVFHKKVFIFVMIFKC